MGLYATTTSIPNILPGFLKGNTTSSDTAGVNLFSHHIDRAEARINAAIASRYDIAGFTSGSIPPLLIKLTEDIAAYRVIRATAYRVADRNEYLEDYKAAEDAIEQLIKGEINLTYTDGSSVAAISASRFLSNTKEYTPIAGLDDEQNWGRDSDEIDEQSSARK